MIEKLLAFGSNQLELKLKMNPKKFINWTEENFNYVKYNPRKKNNRFGLSITSLDGGVTGIPDLDSIHEYNFENSTSWEETSFNVPTPVFEWPELKLIVDPWKNKIFRSHVLKIESGGYFPAHRDSNKLNVKVFRLIVPLENCNPPDTRFMIGDKTLHWNHGNLYFINTLKEHTLFNASSLSSYWIVFNVILNEDSITSIIENLKRC